MKLGNLSVKKRLIISNYIMIIVPVVVIIMLGIGLISLLDITGTMRQQEVTLLWPKDSRALVMQLTLNTLHKKVNKAEKEDIVEECANLDRQGIKTRAVERGQILYQSSTFQEQDLWKYGDSRHKGNFLIWNEKGLFFQIYNQQRAILVEGGGNIPFLVHEPSRGNFWYYAIQGLLLGALFLTLAIIVLMGLFLSHTISKQIILPLRELQKAAEAIGKGNFGYPLHIRAHDEIGQVCQRFEYMRLQLKLAKEEEARYENNRKELIAGISHDLSTPLTAVKGYATGILDGIAKTPEKQKHYLQRIVQASDNMEKLVESLFLFSKLDLQKLPFHLEKVDLRRYFVDYFNEQRSIWQERGLSLSLHLQVAKAWVQVDRLQLQRVIENICKNTLKYRRAQTIPQLSITLEQIDNSIKIQFVDDGIGVQQEELQKIFDSFYRTDKARTDVAKGSGLGLAIVKKIILTMQGKIWVRYSPSYC